MNIFQFDFHILRREKIHHPISTEQCEISQAASAQIFQVLLQFRGLCMISIVLLLDKLKLPAQAASHTWLHNDTCSSLLYTQLQGKNIKYY